LELEQDMGEGTSEITAQGHRVSGPVVSVLVTAFNREKYIAEAIESVLAQTFDDFELIIVDDCSSDHTVEIARRYASDPRVQLHVNERNLGDYPNRNRAASLAKGKYLKYLDSDDMLYPFGLGAMVEMMSRHPSAALGLQRPSPKDRPFPIVLTPEQSYREHYLEDGLFGVGPTGTIILASAFQRCGGFSGKRYVGDAEMWLKLAAVYPVLKFMEGLVWWRSHSEQEIVAGYQTLAYASLDYSIQVQALTASKCPLDANERARAMRWLKYRHARSILRLALAKRHPRNAIEIMRQTGFSVSDLKCAFVSAKGLQN
jgi:glycosyltransferase involved in cell wall biosynthesis